MCVLNGLDPSGLHIAGASHFIWTQSFTKKWFRSRIKIAIETGENALNRALKIRTE